MRYLLDTHVFIWWLGVSSQLSTKALAIIQDRSHQIYLSLASVWEMQIKTSLHKLTLPKSLPDIIRDQQLQNHIQLLGIELEHILALYRLPDHHRDPFDRLIIAQSLDENMPLISNDSMIANYPITSIW